MKLETPNISGKNVKATDRGVRGHVLQEIFDFILSAFTPHFHSTGLPEVTCYHNNSPSDTYAENYIPEMRVKASDRLEMKQGPGPSPSVLHKTLCLGTRSSLYSSVLLVQTPKHSSKCK